MREIECDGNDTYSTWHYAAEAINHAKYDNKYN